MINNPQVPKDFLDAELQVYANTRQNGQEILGRTTLATLLAIAALTALAITSLIQSNQQATAQSNIAMAPKRSMAATPLYVLPDSGELGPFVFGYLEFDWDPAHGIPGFSALPPKSRAQ
jgi:hypothetical protein